MTSNYASGGELKISGCGTGGAVDIASGAGTFTTAKLVAYIEYKCRYCDTEYISLPKDNCRNCGAPVRSK